jgi:signal transduction histidine kinase
VQKGFEELRVEVEGEMKILADAAFPSLVVNLLRNAIVHGGAQVMKVSMDEVKGMAEIRFADDGKGIPNEIKQQLFQEGAKFGETGNTGLGLYIVRKTVERYGGRVWVEDNHPQGAVFVLQIPKANK